MLLFLEDGGIYIEFVLCRLGGPYLAQPNHGLMFITTNRPIGLLEPFILLAAIFHIVFFSAFQLGYHLFLSNLQLTWSWSGY